MARYKCGFKWKTCDQDETLGICYSQRNFLFDFIMFSTSPQFHWNMKRSESPGHHIALRFTLGKADRELYRPLGFGSKIFHYETWPLVLSDGVILCLEVKSLCVCFCVDCADDSGPLLWCYGEWGGRPGSWDVWDWSVGVQGLRRDARQWKVKYDFCIKRIPCWKDPPFACCSRTLNFITFQVY